MEFEAPLPEIEDEKAKPADPPIYADPNGMEDELASAVQAAGIEQVAEAVGQVLVGEARPEALLEWIDDLRDPERHEEAIAPGDEQTGIVPDFIADTQRAFELDIPAGDDDGYFVPTARRKRPEDELEDLGFGGGGGGGNDPPKDDREAAAAKPKAKAAARKPAPPGATAGPKATPTPPARPPGATPKRGPGGP